MASSGVDRTAKELGRDSLRIYFWFFDMVKYAFCLVVFILIVGGAYYSGYCVGSSDTKVEYVTKEKEVIRYVARETANIQAKPNATKKQLLDLMKNNML